MAKTLIFISGITSNNIIIKIIVKITMKISIISHFALIIHKQILPSPYHKCLYAQAALRTIIRKQGGFQADPPDF